MLLESTRLFILFLALFIALFLTSWNDLWFQHVHVELDVAIRGESGFILVCQSYLSLALMMAKRSAATSPSSALQEERTSPNPFRELLS